MYHINSLRKFVEEDDTESGKLALAVVSVNELDADVINGLNDLDAPLRPVEQRG